MHATSAPFACIYIHTYYVYIHTYSVYAGEGALVACIYIHIISLP
jgi:hypothetical protein